MDCVTDRTFPFAYTELFGQRIFIAAAAAKLTAWIGSRNPDDVISVPERFICKHLKEF